MRESFLQGLRDLVPVASVFHIDQVEHDDPAEVAKAYLACDLIDRLEVRLRDRIFEAGVALADELAGVHVDGDESFGLVDDEISAGFEPNAGLKCLLDLFLNAVCIEDGFIACVELYAIDHTRRHSVHKLDRA